MNKSAIMKTVLPSASKPVLKRMGAYLKDLVNSTVKAPSTNIGSFIKASPLFTREASRTFKGNDANALLDIITSHNGFKTNHLNAGIQSAKFTHIDKPLSSLEAAQELFKLNKSLNKTKLHDFVDQSSLFHPSISSQLSNKGQVAFDEFHTLFKGAPVADAARIAINPKNLSFKIVDQAGNVAREFSKGRTLATLVGGPLAATGLGAGGYYAYDQYTNDPEVKDNINQRAQELISVYGNRMSENGYDPNKSPLNAKINNTPAQAPGTSVSAPEPAPGTQVPANGPINTPHEETPANTDPVVQEGMMGSAFDAIKTWGAEHPDLTAMLTLLALGGLGVGAYNLLDEDEEEEEEEE